MKHLNFSLFSFGVDPPILRIIFLGGRLAEKLFFLILICHIFRIKAAKPQVSRVENYGESSAHCFGVRVSCWKGFWSENE